MAIVVLLSCLAIEPPALAQVPATVLIAHEGPTTELDTQLRAELRALGLLVRELPWSRSTDDEWRRSGSVLLRVHGAERVVDIALSLEGRPKEARRESIRPGSGPDETRSLVLRVTELVRAELLPLAPSAPVVAQSEPVAGVPAAPVAPAQTDPPAADPTVASAPAVARSEARPPTSVAPAEVTIRPFAIGLGPSLGLDLDGFGPAFRAQLAALWFVHERVTVSAALLMPTAAQSLSAEEGRTDLRLTLAELGARLELRPARVRFRPHVGMTGGAMATYLSGKASSPNRGTSQLRFAAVATVLIGASLRLTRRLSLALGLQAGAALPRNVVRFAGREVGSVGRPLLLSTLSLQVPFG